jgi:hypothetical protein
MNKIIEGGNKIIVWSKSIQQKDINDMILAGLSVMDVLKSNTYRALEAKIKFNEWKKV